MFRQASLLFFITVLLFISGIKGDLTSYNKRVGAKFIKEVSERPGIHKLKSGMLVEVPCNLGLLAYYLQ